MPVPRPRSAMRKIREILRLALGEGLSRRQVAAATGLPSHDRRRPPRPRPAGGPRLAAARGHGRRAARGPPVRAAPSRRPPASRPLPDWPTVHRELRRKGVTLQLLHLEYKERHPDGYRYTQFCRRYRAWRGRLDLVMRQEHRAGEKLFVDFAGQTLPIVDPDTGEVWQAQLFVAVLGASSYTYAEALRRQDAARLDRRATSTPSRSSGGCPRDPGARTTCARRHQGPPLRARPQPRPTRRWPPTTAVPSSPPAPASPGTRRRSRPASCWPSAGSWPPCGTARSSPSPRPTPRSPSGSPG